MKITTKTGTKTYHAADVLAGAYRGKDVSDRALLVHTVEVDDREFPIKLLCRGTKLDNVITDGDDVERAPTCPRCIERLAKLQSKALKAG